MDIIILAGPSSIGKTTYANKNFKNYTIVDSDKVWFDLAKKYNWDKSKINMNLFKEIVKRAKNSKKSVIVHTNPEPIIKLLKNYKVILLGTNFRNIARNFYKRDDGRTINGVLGNNDNGFLYYYELMKTNEKTNLFLRKKDLELFKPKNKKDKESINIIKNTFFKNKKTARVVPKIDYDEFIILN